MLLFLGSGIYLSGKEIALYHDHGEKTSAKIENVSLEHTLNGEQVKYPVYYIDYSYSVKNKSYLFKHHKINSSTKAQYINPIWAEKTAGDEFDIMYVDSKPETHNILSERKIQNSYVGLPWIFAYFLIISSLALSLFNWNSLFVRSYSISCLLGTFIFIAMKIIDYKTLSNPIYFILMILFLILLKVIFNNLKLMIKGIRTQANITKCEVDMFPKNSGRIIGCFVYKYRYEYKDMADREYVSYKNIYLLFSQRYKIGDIVNIIYNPKAPRTHAITGIKHA